MPESTPPSPIAPEASTLDYYSPSPASGVTRHELAALALRLMGVYVWIHLLELSTVLLSPTKYWTTPGSAVTLGVLVLAYGGGGFILFRFAGAWARYLLPGPRETGVHIRVSGFDLQAIAFSVAGVWLAAGAVPTLCLGLIYYFFKSPTGWLGARWPGLWGTIVQLVLGIALFLGSRGLSIFWHKLRTGGVQPVLKE